MLEDVYINILPSCPLILMSKKSLPQWVYHGNHKIEPRFYNFFFSSFMKGDYESRIPTNNIKRYVTIIFKTELSKIVRENSRFYIMSLKHATKANCLGIKYGSPLSFLPKL